MEKEPTPIGRGEQISLEKKLNNIELTAQKIKELAEMLLDIRRQIEEEYARETAKPEWARRQNILESLQNEFEENNRQLDALLSTSSNLQLATDYIGKKHRELEERKKEEGY